jgi:hypothetical protein
VSGVQDVLLFTGLVAVGGAVISVMLLTSRRPHAPATEIADVGTGPPA